MYFRDTSSHCRRKINIILQKKSFFDTWSVQLLISHTIVSESNINKNPLMIKSMISPTWDPNTSLSFLTFIVKMSTEMKIEEAMYSLNKTYQDHNLKIGVKKN